MTDENLIYYLAQAIGFLAISISFYSITLKDDKAMMTGGIICGLLLFPHFMLLGSMVSAASVLFITIRVWCAKNYPSDRLMYLFLFLSIVQSYLMVTAWTEIFSILSTLIATVVYFKLKGFWMRIGFIVPCILWVVDAIIINSYPNMILNGFGMLIHISTAYRIYKTEGVLNSCYNK